MDSSCPLALAVISTSVSKDSTGKLGAGATLVLTFINLLAVLQSSKI